MAIRYQSNLNKVLRELDNTNETALTMIGEITRSEAQLQSPVKTGNLRDSNDYKVDAANNKVMIGNTVDYALWVHEGTHKTRAYPWLYNSAISSLSRIKAIIRDHYRRLGR